MSVTLNNNGCLYDNPIVSSDFSDISFFEFVKVTTKNQYHDLFFNGIDGGYGYGNGFFLTPDSEGNVLAIGVAYVAWLASSLAITDTNWHFVGYTRRASDGVWTIYLDSSSEEVGNNDPFTPGAESRTSIGGYMNTDTGLVNESSCLFARSAYWDTLLSSTEIGNIRTGTVPNTYTTGLRFYLPYVSGDLPNNDGGDSGDFTANGTVTYSSDEPFAAGSTVVKDIIQTDGMLVFPR